MPQPLLDNARRITLDAQLARAARQTPDATAFQFLEQRRSFEQIDGRVTRLANALLDRGLRHGGRVAVMMNNCLELVEAYIAIGRAGGICVPVNFRLLADETSYILSQSGASMLISDEVCMTVAATAVAAISPRVKLIVVTGADARNGAERYEDLLTASSAAPISGLAADHDPAFIMFTSGTTGRPKGAVLTHFNLLINTMNMISSIEIMRSDRRWLAGLPLFHIGGLNGILPFLYSGGTSVILPTGGFSADQVVDILERERITSCFFVPTQWQAICDVEGVEDRQFCLQRISWGAAVAPPSVVAAIHRTFPAVRTYNVFGQTEMSSVTCVMRTDLVPERSSSIGRPVPGVEVRVVDEAMNEVPIGAPGEIVYRGPTVMQGYWGNPEATAKAFDGDWFHSGDLVKQDPDGFFHVVDRKTDMIISGGENIYCPEVEAVIDEHPAVREVAVIGAAHPKWGETPVAIICLASGEQLTQEEITRWCRERLASYKKPTRVHFVDVLPRNASGKVLKTELRRRYGS